MKKENTIEEISTKEFVERYNLCHTKKIDRHDVYDMIKRKELIAHKGLRGAWVIETGEIKPEKKCKHKFCICNKKTYNTKQFAEKYNEKHPGSNLVPRHVRLLLESGILNGYKEKNVWVITSDPKKRIKYK